MKTPFAVLDSVHFNKTKIAEILIPTVINNGLIFVIVKTRLSLIDYIRKSGIEKVKCKNSIVYVVDDIKFINDGVHLLAKMQWHKPLCHFLIGKKGLEKKIVRACQDSKKKIEVIEKEFDADILCYIEPLDEQLEFYADDFTKKIIAQAFPSLNCEN